MSYKQILRDIDKIADSIVKRIRQIENAKLRELLFVFFHRGHYLRNIFPSEVWDSAYYGHGKSVMEVAENEKISGKDMNDLLECVYILREINHYHYLENKRKGMEHFR